MNKEECNTCKNFKNNTCNITSKQDIAKDKIQSLIESALKELYTKDIPLIESDAHEIAIVVQFFSYFKEKIKSNYPEYDVDMEYNKKGDDPKKCYNSSENEVYGIRPDLIVHKRKHNCNNLLYLEFKKVSNKDTLPHDYEKLIEVTLPINKFPEKYKEYGYDYKFAASILLDERSAKIVWFENGKKGNTTILNY